MIPLVLDGAITLLLIVTISYAWRLNKRINTLHSSRKELNFFLQEFNDSILRAEHNINELKSMGSEAESQLIQHINKARYLANDLSFLAEKGENVADTLEHYIMSTREIRKQANQLQANTPRQSSKPAARNSASPSGLVQKRHAEAEAVLPRKQQAAASEEYEYHSPMTESKKRALQEVLEQIAERRAVALNPSIKRSSASLADKRSDQQLNQELKRLVSTLEKTQATPAPPPDARKPDTRKSDAQAFTRQREYTPREKVQHYLREPIDT